MDDTNGGKQQVTTEQDRMLKKVAKVAARRLTPIETHSICVLLSMAFGRGTSQSRTFAWHVNEVRSALGLPQVTQAAAGAFDNLIWPHLDTYNWPHLINKDAGPVRQSLTVPAGMECRGRGGV